MAATIWTNGSIVTMADQEPSVEAVLTVDGHIVHTGTLAEVIDVAPRSVRTVDLGGAVMFPGFIEAHNHMLMYGLGLAAIDARPVALPSIAALVGSIRERAAATPSGQWIIARGYDDNQLDERRHPTRHDLDQATAQHPVLLVNGSGHLGVANSLALQVARIDSATGDPQGGTIVRDEHRVATGLLLETAQASVRRHNPAPAANDLLDALAACQQRYRAAGITSSHTAGVNTPAELGAHQRWAEGSDHPIRVTMMIGHSVFPSIRDSGLHTGFGDDSLRIGPLKLFSDGSLIGRTAAVSQPFLEDARDDNLGMEMMPAEELDVIVADAHERGFQVAIHAIGDRAIEMCLDAYRNAQQRAPRRDARHRIEHCGILRPDLIGRLRDESVIPVSQPVFIREYGDGFIRHLGRERAQLTYPFRSLLDEGIPLVFSSDCPVSTFEPLASIQAAVAETTNQGTSYAPAEAISARDAIRCYTRNGAYAGFAEDRIGSIEPGFLADFTILAADPADVAPDEIDRIDVMGTVIGGELVHQSPMMATGQST